VAILQQELRDMSKERTMDASAARTKQHQFDRQIADMSLQISKLQSILREAQRDEGGSKLSGSEESRHVKELTEQVVRQQEKLGHATSEVAALRSRLDAAVSRAEKAERAMLCTESFDVESGPESGNFGSSDGMRHRRRRKEEYDSIRSAINLNVSQNQNTERLGKAIDALDKFSVETGKYLRYNPLARGGFLLYLLLLHMWTLVVFFVHTHRFETVHGDFGAGQQLAHGPHALMQHHDPEILKQIVAQDEQAVADNSGKKFPSGAENIGKD
jgi:hypothetical protein